MTHLAAGSDRKFRIVYCGAVFVASALSVYPFVSVPDEDRGVTSLLLIRIPWIFSALMLACIASWFFAISNMRQQRMNAKFLIPTCLFGIGIARVLNVYGTTKFRAYGDVGRLQTYLSDGKLDFGRWLLTLAIVRESFSLIRTFFFDIDPGDFVRVTGALCMFTSALWLLARRTDSVIPQMLIVSPMWVLFSIGYDEFYPFVAGLLVVVICHIVAREVFFRSSTAYLLAGILPALYIGALPISLVLLLHTWGIDRIIAERVRGLLLSLVSFVIAIEVGGEFNGYIGNLSETMNLGGKFLDKDANSKAIALSSRSFLADPSYAFSLEHAVDIFFWLSCGIGIVVIVAALILSAGPKHKAGIAGKADTTSDLGLCRLATFLLVGLALFYLVFMLPLLGPTRDIDLYFISMFVLLIFAGSRFDHFAQTAENPRLERLRFAQLSAFGFAPATMALVVFGVTR